MPEREMSKFRGGNSSQSRIRRSADGVKSRVGYQKPLPTSRTCRGESSRAKAPLVTERQEDAEAAVQSEVEERIAGIKLDYWCHYEKKMNDLTQQSKAEVEEVKGEVHSLEEKCSQLENKLAEAKQGIRDKEAKISALKRHEDTSRKSHQDHQLMEQTLNEKLKKKEIKLRDTEQKVSRLNKEKERLEEELEEVKEKGTKVSVALKEAENLAEQKSDEVENEKRKTNEVLKKLKALQERNSELESKQKESDEKQKSIQNQSTTKDRRIAELLQQNQSEKEKYENSKVELLDLIQTTKDEKNELEKNHNKSLKTLNEAQEMLVNLKSENQVLKNATRDMASENSAVKKQLYEVTQQKERMVETMEEQLINDKSTCEKALKEANNKIDALIAEKNNLEEIVSKVEAKNENLHLELRIENKEEFVQMGERIKSLSEETKSLREENEQLLKENKAKETNFSEIQEKVELCRNVFAMLAPGFVGVAQSLTQSLEKQAKEQRQ